MLVVEMDKADTELPAPIAGTVVDLAVPAGATVDVGSGAGRDSAPGYRERRGGESMTTTQISPAPFAELARGFHGSVILPDDPRWDRERVLWNSMFDRQPLAIAKCTGDADVVAAVRFARAHDLPISVRSGGHDAGGKSVLDDTYRDRPQGDGRRGR